MRPQLYAALCCVLILSEQLQGQTADSFNPQIFDSIYSLAIQPDGKILIGGPSSLARLNADGTSDTAFTNAGPPYSTTCLALQSDQKILVGGNFTQLRNQSRNNLGRLNSDGSLDALFNPGANDIVNCFAIQPDGKVLVGGRFTFLGGWTSLAIARLNTNGTLDTNFVAQTSGTVNSIALQADGKIVVGGIFSFSGSGQPRANISRLNADGTSDMNFNPGVNGWVEALTVQPDGKILVGGCFGAIAGQARTNIARLNSDGTMDSDFHADAGVFTQPGAGSSFVFSLALQADGKILVGGSFDSLAGQTCYRLGRLQSSGDFDSSFNAGVNNNVYSLALQSDGKLLAGGFFSTLGGTNREYLGRLNSTGTAAQALTNDGTTLTWTRYGTCPEVQFTSFAASTDGLIWTNLGYGTRISNGWQLAGISINTNVTIRARGQVSSGEYSGSGWFVEKFLSPPTTNHPTLALHLDGRLPLLNLSGDIGRPYLIEFTPAPETPDSWQNMTSLLLTNSSENLYDFSGSNVSQRFYRARLNQ